MGFSEIIKLLGGIALFLYGMKIMGNSLEAVAGSRLKTILGKLTSNPLKGITLGAIATVLIQSSAATIVMAVGFVNSGLMTLAQAGSVIIGANFGTSITGWVVSASSIKNSDAIYYAILFLGFVLFWFFKKKKIKNIGLIMLGFSILMIGMQTMSGSVSGFKDSDLFGKFSSALTNPALGFLFGIVFTAMLQSSSASIGVLQSFSNAAAVPFSVCIPFVLGAAVGKSTTALISAIGATKDAKRAAMFDFVFNTIMSVGLMIIYVAVRAVFNIAFFDSMSNALSIALLNTVIKAIEIVICYPFIKYIVAFTSKLVRDKKDSEDNFELLDDRLLATPTIALEHAKRVAVDMAELSITTLKNAEICVAGYTDKLFGDIVKAEDRSDMYEDKIGTYLVKLSGQDLSDKESLETTQLLKLIGDYERISDHAMNIAASGEELHEKKVMFTGEAQKDITTMFSAVTEILTLSHEAYVENNVNKALLVEPLEEVVDYLRDSIKERHIERLRKGGCTIEMGFVLIDLLTDLERVSDHCSNIACYVIESTKNDMDVHDYLNNLKKDDAFFSEKYNMFKDKYKLA